MDHGQINEVPEEDEDEETVYAIGDIAGAFFGGVAIGTFFVLPAGIVMGVVLTIVIHALK